MNRIHAYNLAATLLAAAGSALLDYSLELGQLHGIVYTLYLLICSALQLILNAALATYHQVRGGPALDYLISAAAYPALGAAMAYAPALL